MRAKEYPLLVRAIEEGVDAGWRHHWKHREGAPPESSAAPLREDIAEAVLAEVLGCFSIEEPPAEGCPACAGRPT